VDRVGRKMTVCGWLDQWLRDQRAKDLTACTVERYETPIRRRLKPRLGDVPLKDLDATAIRTYFADLADEENARACAGSLSSASRIKDWAVLNKALRDAVHAGVLARNPCEGAERPRLAERETVALSKERASAFIRESRLWPGRAMWAVMMAHRHAHRRAPRAEVVGGRPRGGSHPRAPVNDEDRRRRATSLSRASSSTSCAPTGPGSSRRA